MIRPQIAKPCSKYPSIHSWSCVVSHRFVFLLFCLILVSAQATPRVLILANRDDGESLAIARHYAKRRGLPKSAIVSLPMPLTEQITWPQFVTSIWNPLLREAIARGDIDAISMDLKDELGRMKIAPSGHRLDALVICRGVPLRVAHDSTLLDERGNPLTANRSLRSVEGAVDSELALLALGSPPIAAFVPNPVFNASGAAAEEALRNIIPVGRLDGPSADDAKALVDRAIEAERDGLAGRAYVDIGGPHRQGNEWLEACVPELTALGFETDVDKARATFGKQARFDAPVLYFGWYTSHLNGPFAEPGFRFPPGAIALHIHSYSASTLRSPTRGWAGPFVARGVTATFGNVGEPYLQFTHQPHLLLRALARGDTLGVAALRSINALSWKAIVLGDPLYRPFAVSADAQWDRRGKLSPAAETYARIRRMRLLANAGRGDEALSLGRDGMLDSPSLPLALTLAGMEASTGDLVAARRTLGVFAALPDWRPVDRPLVMAAARALRAAEAPAEAVKLCERLLEAEDLPKAFRLEVLKEGAEIARAAMDFTRSGRWDAEYERLTAPPSPPPGETAKPAAAGK
mgnify:FL=1|jgi:TIGR03790 family protein